VSKTDKTWKYYGETDPYFGVLTNDRFKKENLDEEARSAFFASGESYIEHALEVVHNHLDGDFVPVRALDFGCGVGRLALPLARRCEAVVGVDVSPSMLAEAATNARDAGLSNVEFVTSDDTLSQVEGTFNLIHSFIVFQHIPVDRGERIARSMVDRLREGGVGILQFTYANSTTTPPPATRRALTAGYAAIPPLHGLRNLIKGLPFRQPPMQMNRYDLNKLFRLLQESGCHEIHARFTEASHFGFPIYGVVVFFSRKRHDVTAYH
jgi:SAM-dependent methyltransferase